MYWCKGKFLREVRRISTKMTDKMVGLSTNGKCMGAVLSWMERSISQKSCRSR